MIRPLAFVVVALLVPLAAAAQSGTWNATVLVNTAASGNLNAHQARYSTVTPTLASCATTLPALETGAFTMWRVVEGGGDPPSLQASGELGAADDGGTVWGEDRAFAPEFEACVGAALGSVAADGAGEIYITVEFTTGAQ